MQYLSYDQQTKKEEYEKKQKATTIYKIITNEPISPDVDLIEKLKKLKDDPFLKFSMNDYDLICTNKMVKNMMVIALNTTISKLNAICKKIKNFKKHIDLSPITIKEKMKAEKSPLIDLSQSLRDNSISAHQSLSLLDLTDDLITKITQESYTSLLRYKLLKGCHKIDWNALSLNPYAIDFLSLPENKKYIRYANLSRNPNPKAMELLIYEILKNNEPLRGSRINWGALSENPNAQGVQSHVSRINWIAFSENPNAIDFLSLPENKKYIKYPALSANTNPKAIALLREEISINPNNINWISLSSNPNPEAIVLLRENYHNIDWEKLSGNPIKEAIVLLRENYHNIDWNFLSSNPTTEAIALIEEELNINPDNRIIDWYKLSSNPKAIHLLKKYRDKIKWRFLSGNADHGAIKLIKEELEINPDNIDWVSLSANPKAMKILSLPKYYNNIKWSELSRNPNAIELLEKPENYDKIDWYQLSRNSNARNLLQRRLKYEKNLSKNEYRKLPNSKIIDKFELSKNPAIFTLT